MLQLHQRIKRIARCFDSNLFPEFPSLRAGSHGEEENSGDTLDGELFLTITDGKVQTLCDG